MALITWIIAVWWFMFSPYLSVYKPEFLIIIVSLEHNYYYYDFDYYSYFVSVELILLYLHCLDHFLFRFYYFGIEFMSGVFVLFASFIYLKCI